MYEVPCHLPLLTYINMKQVLMASKNINLLKTYDQHTDIKSKNTIDQHLVQITVTLLSGSAKHILCGKIRSFLKPYWTNIRFRYCSIEMRSTRMFEKKSSLNTLKMDWWRGKYNFVMTFSLNWEIIMEQYKHDLYLKNASIFHATKGSIYWTCLDNEKAFNRIWHNGHLYKLFEVVKVLQIKVNVFTWTVWPISTKANIILR